MKSRLLLGTFAALVASTVVASAQNPPGANFEDRGIREDAGRPGQPRGAAPAATMPGTQQRGTIGQGQGQPGPQGQPEPPGGRFQDEKNNEEQGQQPSGRN